MKFFHISDLHIGRRICGFSLLEDQRFVLKQILDLAREKRPDGVLLAGDLYDKSMPSAEAVELADWFLTELAKEKIAVFVISGNHDCAQRVSYGAHMLEASGIYVSHAFDGTLQRVTFKKEGCKIKSGVNPQEGWQEEKERSVEVADLYLLPFVRPAQVRPFFPGETVETTQQAVGRVKERGIKKRPAKSAFATPVYGRSIGL